MRLSLPSISSLSIFLFTSPCSLLTNIIQVQWWKDALLEAISPNGKVLVDVIPEAEAIMGPQPPVPILPPAETKTRFERVFLTFVQVFLSKFTAVLFLDGILLKFLLNGVLNVTRLKY